MARQIENGETVAQGLATPLVAAAYLLARHTHAPNLYFTSAIGQSICRKPAPMSISNVESLWLDLSLTSIGFTRAAAEILPTLRPKEFFRPAQIDPAGNFNNIGFGKNYLEEGRKYPRLRLPGTGGIPDVTTFSHDVYLYVPHHSRVIFVPELDVRSGLGHAPERTRGEGPKYLISNLGQFDFSGGIMRLISYHPNGSIDNIKSHTGFDLAISPDVEETLMPTSIELKLLRQEIDPLGIRRLELLSGAPRRQLLHDILNQEKKNR
jgi:acyl CoA:acetate/3-ketoacid CoA transferase beta subunit